MREVESCIQKKQCCFHPGDGVDQLFILLEIFEGVWEFHQPAYMCFMDLEKEFDHHTSQHSAPVQESLICISSNKSGLFLPFVQDSLHNF